MNSDRASGEAAFQQLGRQLQSQLVPLKGEVSEVAVCLRIIQVDQSMRKNCTSLHHPFFLTNSLLQRYFLETFEMMVIQIPPHADA